MEKANVMKALDCCLTGDCWGCPYHDDMEESSNCDQHLLTDVLALLKTEHKANDKPKYPLAYIFTKRDNLMKWYNSLRNPIVASYEPDYYAREREIQLILLVRYEANKPICLIKCPINPLPIKGEFEAASVPALERLLNSLGWNFKEKFNLHMFQ